jgi:hypothetical protein
MILLVGRRAGGRHIGSAMGRVFGRGRTKTPVAKRERNHASRLFMINKLSSGNGQLDMSI